MQACIAGHDFEVLAQRALYWPAQHMLLLSDLHLGKTDIFRRAGLGVPIHVQTADLQRLHQLLEQWTVHRCVILGDFVHGPHVSATSAQAWSQLVQHHSSTSFELVVGNHDRSVSTLGLELHDVHIELSIGDVCLTHEPLNAAALQAHAFALNIHGHIHPSIRIPGSRQKAPVLAWHPPHLCLPAFSEFTAGLPPRVGWEALWLLDMEGGEVFRL